MPNVELFMTRTKLKPGVRTRANFFFFVFLVGAIRPQKIGTDRFILVCVPLMKLHTRLNSREVIDKTSTL